VAQGLPSLESSAESSVSPGGPHENRHPLESRPRSEMEQVIEGVIVTPTLKEKERPQQHR